MTRSLMLVLLLATGVALADDPPKAKSGNSAAESQKKAKAKAQEKAKTEADEKAKAEAEAKAKAEAQEKAKAEAQATAVEDPGAKQDPSAKPNPNAKDNPDLGMSILGNQETPKALVIVPWKSSEMGNALGISTLLDDSRQPVDKEVFMRMLSYYEIRSEAARPSGVPANGNAAAPATAAQRRKP